MAKKEKNKPGELLFERKNYIIMVIGIFLILLGFALMAGGGSDDPEVFNKAMYNFQKIRLAPTLVLLGLGVQIYAIFTGPSKK